MAGKFVAGPLLNKFGGLTKLAQASFDDLQQVKAGKRDGKIETAYILGMAKINGAVKAWLNLDRVLAGQQFAALSGR